MAALVAGVVALLAGGVALLVWKASSSAIHPAPGQMPWSVAAWDGLSPREVTVKSVTVEGHADPRGADDHNLQLSRQRADSVVSYLVRERGMPSERLEAVGKGSHELMNKAVPAAPENRRVTIVARPAGG